MGTGLGLAISQRLAQAMGGRIWAISGEAIAGDPPPNWHPPTATGSSTTFYFTIAGFAEPAAAVPPASLTGKRLLSISNRPSYRQAMRAFADTWQLSLLEIASPQDEIAATTNLGSFDIAIFDLPDTEADDIAWVRQLQNLPDGEGVPIILLGAWGVPEPDFATAGLNGVTWLHKPLKQSLLYQAMSAYCTGEEMATTLPIPVRGRDRNLGQAHPLRILVAEDNAVNQKVMLRLLERLGYRGDIAANGLETLSALERRPYDTLLLDVQMPEMDGLETAREIAARWSEAERPHTIAVTANATRKDREDCLQAGMNDYISKPVTVESLAAALQRCPLPAPKAISKPPPAIERACLDELARMYGTNDPTLLAETIAIYLEESPQLMLELAEAVASSDAIAARRLCHSLKSSSSTLGALTFAEFCRQLEAQDLPTPEQLSALQHDFAGVCSALEALRAEYSQLAQGLPNPQSQ